MKRKKCPYCGRSISYLTVFHEKKHGVYECSRCKKDSKIKIDKKMFIFFGVTIFLILCYFVFWKTSDFYDNILGIIPPIVFLVVFYFCTPLFIKFVPLKRFISHEDTIRTETEVEQPQPVEEFVFDRKVFEEIKNKRNAKSSVEERIDRIISEEEPYIPIIEDVSEAHSSSDAPLKKMTKPHMDDIEVYEDVKEYVPKKDNPDGSKYTANRML